MKFNVESLDPINKILHVEVPKEDVIEALNNAYSELKKTANVKGFRRGKIPRSVLEKLYKKDIHKNVSSQLIQDGISRGLHEKKIRIVNSEKINPPELSPTDSYSFDIKIETKPDIGEINFKKLKLKKTLYEVSTEEIDTQLGMLQQRLAKRESLEKYRPIKNSDIVTLDYEGFKDGHIYEEIGSKENFVVEIGAASISSDFDKNIEKMEVNEEKKFEIKFPEDYSNKNLANIAILFKVKIKDIQTKVLPEIDDEMAKELGPFETLEDLKAKISENLEQGYEKRTEHELNEQIFIELINRTQFELPKTMVEYELSNIVDDAEKTFKYHNKSLEDVGLTRENLSKKYEEIARKQVRRQLILEQIIEQEKISVSNKELEDGYSEIASNYDKPVESIRTFYSQNPEQLNSFKHALLEKKAIAIIIKDNDIEETKPELIKTNEE